MAFDTVSDLLAHISRLPSEQQLAARDRVALAIEGPAPAARAALGLLALDLAVDEPEAMIDADVLVVPELASDRVTA